MKANVTAGFVLILFLTACQTKQEYFTRQQLQHKSDSLTTIRFKELQEQADEDLDRRIAIEVKPKVDSILDKEGLPAIIAPSRLDTSITEISTDTSRHER